jgi:hypothetical protein
VWKSVGLMTGQIYTNMSVVFEDVQFHRATNIPKEGLCNNRTHHFFSLHG